MEFDRTMVEINPVAELTNDHVIACSTKAVFDDNAEFRHKATHEQRDVSQEGPAEVETKKHDPNYIKLDGNVACMVNRTGSAISKTDSVSRPSGPAYSVRRT